MLTTVALRRAVIGFGLCATIGFVSVQEASAALVKCPSDADVASDGYTRQYGVDTDPSSVCYAYGSGNLNGQGNDAFMNLPDNTTDWEWDEGFDFTAAPDNRSGTFTIEDYDPTLQYALGIKDGGTPKWAVFLLPFGEDFDGTGLWYVLSAGGSLSHLALYSVEGPVTPGEEPLVPEPATLALLGVALLAGGARARRRTNP